MSTQIQADVAQDEFTEEDQTALRDSVRRLLSRQWTTSSHDVEALHAVWQALADQGLLALGASAYGDDLPAAIITMQELGRVACCAPLADAVLMNLALHGNDAAAGIVGRLHGGQCLPTFALGAFDGDTRAASARIDAGTLRATLPCVDVAPGMTELLVLDDAGEQVAIYSPQPNDAAIRPTAALALTNLACVDLEDTPVQVFELTPGNVHELNLVARLFLLARAWGAAQRGFELAVEHARTRVQFGQPIGKFQAIQHKLANALIHLEGTRLTLHAAAASRCEGRKQWEVRVLSALAYGSTALRQVILEVHHTLGAIGYSEEHEAPRYFRLVHGDLARHGGAARARAELAALLLDRDAALPEHTLSAAGEAFRQEVRQWLAQHWNAARRAEHDALPFEKRGRNAQFEKALGEQGWIGVSWPAEFGGQARTPFEQMAYIEELDRVDAPGVRLSLQAPALMKFGTPAQQRKFLPALLHGKILICLGYSESEAGSDLASLRTQAKRDGDGWRINGQKLWSTHATEADYIWLAARTDPQASPKHAGISMFLVPARHPGVIIRPSMAMYGRNFSTIILDDVRLDADALIGPENAGWKILTAALAEERMLMGSIVNRTRRIFEDIVAHLKHDVQTSDAVVRDRLGALAADIEVARALVLNCVRMAENGETPTVEAAISKVYSAELMQRLGESAIDMLGSQAILSQGAPGAIGLGEIEQFLRHSIMYVVGGGTAEIQRNLIAQRGLNLPR